MSVFGNRPPERGELRVGQNPLGGLDILFGHLVRGESGEVLSPGATYCYVNQEHGFANLDVLTIAANSDPEIFTAVTAQLKALKEQEQDAQSAALLAEALANFEEAPKNQRIRKDSVLAVGVIGIRVERKDKRW